MQDIDIEAMTREQEFIMSIYDLLVEWGAFSKHVFTQFAVAAFDSSYDAEHFRMWVQANIADYFVDTNGTQIVIIDLWHKRR